MIKIIYIFILSIALATVSQHNIPLQNKRLRFRDDWALFLLAISLTLFAGLRTSYNDTDVYMEMFQQSRGLAVFLSNPENLRIFANPLFYFLVNLLREFTDNPQVMIFMSSAFVQICYVRFLRRYSENFIFSIFLYFALGTFHTTLAIIKQSMAVAVFTLGFSYLQERKWGKYYLVVLAATLFHSFAIVFAILPLFDQRPWSLITFAFVSIAAFALMNFQETLEELAIQAENIGLSVSMREMTHEYTVNPFRVAVYLVPPLFSLLFARYINPKNTRSDNIMIHMSIISAAVMMMGTQSGANIFARMAHYFEIGTVCCLPGILKRPFVQSSHRLVVFLAVLGFMGFFVYGNRGFDAEYSAISLLDLF